MHTDGEKQMVQRAAYDVILGLPSEVLAASGTEPE